MLPNALACETCLKVRPVATSSCPLRWTTVEERGEKKKGGGLLSLQPHQSHRHLNTLLCVLIVSSANARSHHVKVELCENRLNNTRGGVDSLGDLALAELRDASSVYARPVLDLRDIDEVIQRLR